MNRDAKWLQWFEQQFYIVAGGKHQINLSDFKRALNVKQVICVLLDEMNVNFVYVVMNFIVIGYMCRFIVSYDVVKASYPQRNWL